MSNKSQCKTSRSVSSKKSSRSQREQICLEVERQKEKLRHEHEMKMLELELREKLASIDDGSEDLGEDAKSIDSIVSQGPNLDDWNIGGNPWSVNQNRQCSSSTAMQVGSTHFINDSPVAATNFNKMLTRQSIPNNLPVFTGENPTEFPNFIAQYKNTTTMCGYTDEENQSRLQMCLKGHARKIVESLLIFPQNVGKIIEILEKRFGRPEQLIMLLIDRIRNLRDVKEDRLETLIEFSDEIRNVVGTIESLNQVEYLTNPILLQELLNKLSTNLKMEWIQYFSSIATSRHKPRLSAFSSWLEQKADIACQIRIFTVPDVKYDRNNFKQRSNPSDKRAVTMTVTAPAAPTKTGGEASNDIKLCVYCKNAIHALVNCPNFLESTVDDRWNFVRSNRMCFSCLMLGHSLRNCRKVKTCGINDCTKPHHKLLHKDVQVTDDTSNLNSSNSHTDSNYHISSTPHTLLKILPVELSKGDKTIQTYALLDDASTVTLIDQDLADELNLDGPNHNLCLRWTSNQTQEQSDSRIVTCYIQAPGDKKKFQLRHMKTIRGMSLPRQSVNMDEMVKKYPHLDKRIPSMTNVQPQILIGQDNCPLLLNRQVIASSWNSPVLTKTLLGWTIHGNVNVSTALSTHHVYCTREMEKDDIDLLHEAVKRQWQIDSFGLGNITKTMSREDKRAQDILDRTMKRRGTQFETGLLWKDEDFKLPESYQNAMKRLLITERKMDKNPEFAKSYSNKLEDMVNKKYLRKLTNEEIGSNNPKIWYLPHFGVVNPNKPGKLRIVFDAAAKSNGFSLNDYLLKGPDLYNSLYKILLNFRNKKIAFTADIKEMFLQVLVRKEDQSAQRILWRHMDRERAPDVYEMDVVFFGSTSGPCLAQEAKNRNAYDFMHQFPEASHAIIEDHYMDDYLGNSDTEEEAMRLIEEVIYVHSKGGFKICNWICNSKRVLSSIDADLRSSGEKLLDENVETVDRVLGIWWNSNEDNFTFKSNFNKIRSDILSCVRRPTKRDVLKLVMSVFDPIGFLTNFLIQGKILLQEIWRCGIGWDDEIPDFLNDTWMSWVTNLKSISNFQIQRQYFPLKRDKCDIQLHIFTDSSNKAYASVAYLRYECGEEVYIAFVTSKARVAPLKPLSIPRLELQGALIGSRLGNYLKENLNLNISGITYWTDSKTVLHWIRSEAGRFKTFVAQRIGEIQDLTNCTQWRYVPSKENVADLATKLRQVDFSNDSFWMSGPKFLRLPADDWPKEIVNDIEFIRQNSESLELSGDNVFVTSVTETFFPDPTRFSKWNKILRATAWCFRFVQNCKRQKLQGILNVSELVQAEFYLFRKIQIESYMDEIECLKQTNCVRKTSRLYTLSPQLDEKSIIRLSGRLNLLNCASEDMKNPIILDSKHPITKLILRHYHEICFHHGHQTVVSKIRERFWIPHVRQAVRDVIKTCLKCKIKTCKPEPPMMGQLPLCRLEPTIRSFINTGVDYFGPIVITVRRSTEKRYGVIFTCMATRAIHLEIAHDLSTNGFIHVLRQFGCRRGFPENLYSDNGQSFKSADRELTDALTGLNQTDIKTFCTLQKINWHFIPPVSPFMGGAWERLIQSIKKVMKELLQSRHPYEYVLKTVFAEAENIINSRPLTHISVDSHDPEPLTPNHFLIGPSYASLPATITSDKDLNLLSRWRAAQRLSDHFWKRWTTEYMPFLVRRSKWHQETEPVKEDDIVIIVDPNGPRNIWPKGRVVKTYVGKDGRIRIVDVMLSNRTVLRRPVAKICRLELH